MCVCPWLFVLACLFVRVLVVCLRWLFCALCVCICFVCVVHHVFVLVSELALCMPV